MKVPFRQQTKLKLYNTLGLNVETKHNLCKKGIANFSFWMHIIKNLPPDLNNKH